MLIENIYNQISIIEREIAVLPEEALQIRSPLSFPLNE